MDVEQLEKLGLTKASSNIRKQLNLKNKLTIAYEHYRVVTPTIIDRFNDALRKKTEKDMGGYTTYEKLIFIKLADYPEVPPQFVLDDLQIAMDRQCFDAYEVAKIDTIEERPDPIIFGRINGCDERFFISQWDDDVKIEDILRDNEG